MPKISWQGQSLPFVGSSVCFSFRPPTNPLESGRFLDRLMLKPLTKDRELNQKNKWYWVKSESMHDSLLALSTSPVCIWLMSDMFIIFDCRKPLAGIWSYLINPNLLCEWKHLVATVTGKPSTKPKLEAKCSKQRKIASAACLHLHPLPKDKSHVDGSIAHRW